MSNQVLKLTGIVQPGESSNVYVGRIKEISGIISQGETKEEAFNKLKSLVHAMMEYKQEDFQELLKQQSSSKDKIIQDVREVGIRVELQVA